MPAAFQHRSRDFPNIFVIVRHKAGNECNLMHWGLISYWAKDPSIGNRMINARAETLTTSRGLTPVHYSR
jgi:putative SOS response-associated peptidase YedK